MKKSKKAIISFAICAAIASQLAMGASAAPSFSEEADFIYRKVSMTKETKIFTAGKSMVNWKYSCIDGYDSITTNLNHKMWFSIREADGSTVKDSLLNYLEKKEFSTSCKSGVKYTLYAKREHIINPWTFVSGAWKP